MLIIAILFSNLTDCPFESIFDAAGWLFKIGNLHLTQTPRWLEKGGKNTSIILLGS